VTTERKQWIGWLIVGAKAALFALLCWCIYYSFVRGHEQLNAHDWHAEPAWLVVSGLLYLVGMFPAAAFWHRVLLRAGQEVGFAQAIRAYYLSQLGKYVPGKWMVILLRSGAVRGRPIETTVVAASIFFETFTMLAVGAALSALLLIADGLVSGDWPSGHLLMIAMAIGSACLLGVPTIPVVFQWLLHVLRVGKLNPTAGAKIGRIGLRAIVIGWVTISCGWLVQGMSLWATLRAMGATVEGPFQELSLHTVAVALGLVAGFISQIPGGLGMREWVSAELVEPRYGASVAIVSAVMFRLVMLVAEITISIALYLQGWLRPRALEQATEPEISTGAQRP
jgi:hypothetical protein